MPKRDYAVRSRAKKSSNKLLIFIIILLLLLLSGLGLWILSSQPPATQPTTVAKMPQIETPKASLPSRPEEIYSYIRDLETREVPVDKNSKLAKLTKEQEQQILQRQEEEKRRLAAAQAPASTSAASEQAVSSEPQTTNPAQATATESTAEQSAEKQAAQQAADEKRKQAELKKQQDLAKQEAAKKAELEKQKAAQAKVVATAKPAAEAPKSTGKFGLQCGAFKNKAQAENMQARLAMSGYNARISSSADWNRVIVGPVGDRAAASAAQSNARSVAECLIIGM